MLAENDTYSNALFKTAKYVPSYPGYFASLGDAQLWFADFVHWYTTKHRHSAIGYVTPEQRHTGVAVGIKLPVLVGENFPVSCP